VVEACQRWREIDAQATEPLLYYQDGGSFLNIHDSREAEFRSGTFTGLERELYLFCLEMRSFTAITQQFVGVCNIDAATIQAVLGQFVADRLMFAEQGKYLSLAVAPSPQAAARRLRAAR